MKLGSLFLLALGVGVFGAGCGGQAADPAGDTVDAANVKVAEITERGFRRELRVYASVEPMFHASLGARVPGTLDEILVDEGDVVAAGAVLFQTDKVALENQVEVARQELSVADTLERKSLINVEYEKTKMAKAEVDFRRAATLVATSAISQHHHELAELNFKGANALLAQADADLEYAKARRAQAANNLEIAVKNLDDSRVRSHFDGVVVARYREPGEYASPGTPVLRLESPGRLEIRMAIGARHYGNVVPGQTKVAIHSPDGQRMAELTVGYRSPSVDPKTRTFIVKVELPDSLPLISGMLCEVSMAVEQSTALGVPDESVIRRSASRSVIFIVDGEVCREIEVAAGISYGGFTKIDSEIELAGKLALTHGQAFVADGDRVRVAAESAGAEHGLKLTGSSGK